MGGRTRRRIGSAARLCNGRARRPGRLGLALLGALALAAGGLIGCQEDPPPMQATDAAPSGPRDAEVDAAVVPPVPVAPLELFRRMPQPPPPIAAVPGDLAQGLTRARPSLKPSTYTGRVLVDRPPDGPFRMIHYQLTPDGRAVRAVLATLAEGYAAPERRAALEEAISLRLGEGAPITDKAWTGTRWTTLPFRVDLRTDAATGDLELLYHRRGRVDPVEAPQP